MDRELITRIDAMDYYGRNTSLREDMVLDNRVTSVPEFNASEVEARWETENMHREYAKSVADRNAVDYSSKLSKHSRVPKELVVDKPRSKGGSERSKRLNKILTSGNVYANDRSAYQNSGIDISQRQGDFIGDIVDRLSR